MIGAAIVQMLADPDMVALVGDRVYPVRLPAEPVLPAIAYQVVTESRKQAPWGRLPWVKSLVQLSVVGATYGEAHAVANALRQVLDRRRGVFAGIEVRGVVDEGMHDEGDDAGPRLVATTWRIHWKEP